MPTKVEIFNMALAHAGSSKFVASINELSTEARLCRTFYDVARQTSLSEGYWPFSTKYVDLGEVAENPNEEWSYSYRYPTEALVIRRIRSGLRSDSAQSRIPYREANDATGRLIYTDVEDATAEIAEDIDDEALFTIGFANALSYRLAAYIIPALTSGDPFKLRDAALQLYARELSAASASAQNAEHLGLPVESEFIRVRE